MFGPGEKGVDGSALDVCYAGRVDTLGPTFLTEDSCGAGVGCELNFGGAVSIRYFFYSKAHS